jgi:hypothetical protein
MPLVGFAGIDFMAYRRKSKPALMAARWTIIELAAAFGRFLRSTASGMSLVGTFAWTGRALQAECECLEQFE